MGLRKTPTGCLTRPAFNLPVDLAKSLSEASTLYPPYLSYPNHLSTRLLLSICNINPQYQVHNYPICLNNLYIRLLLDSRKCLPRSLLGLI